MLWVFHIPSVVMEIRLRGDQEVFEEMKTAECYYQRAMKEIFPQGRLYLRPRAVTLRGVIPEKFLS